ncbi:hypothetical protein Golomagni_04302 [Golovinomyces magnicellulatus]|nr:hypothetical protein Golomagni_04302 [Golovinomyces magnicellulatus]
MNNQNTVDTKIIFNFQEELMKWSKPEYDSASPTQKKRLRSFLREYGIYSGYLKGNIIPQLIAFLSVENLSIWDEDELKMITEIHPKSLFQQPLIKKDKIGSKTSMERQVEPMTSFNLDDVSKILAYQTISSPEFLYQELEPNAA